GLARPPARGAGPARVPGPGLPRDRGGRRLFVRRRQDEPLAGPAAASGGVEGAPVMKCDEIRESIAEYHDRELAPDRAERVREHLAGCASCAGELRELEGLETALRGAPARADDVRWDAY